MARSSKKQNRKNRKPKTRQEGNPRRNGVAAAAILATTVLLILVIGSLPNEQYSTDMSGAEIHYDIGKVTAVLSESLQDSDIQNGLKSGSQTLQVRLLTGEHKGETVQASNALSTYNSVVMKTGRFVIVTVDQLDSGAYQVRVYNYFRMPIIILMAALFIAALIFVGGKKGLMAAVGLIYTFACVLLVFLPLVVRGYSPVLAAILLVVMVTAATMVFLNGVTVKSLCAIIGTVCGVVLSGVILFVFGRLMHVSGYSLDDAEPLLLIGQTTGLKVRDLLFAGILIASLGAVMDIAISIVSAIHEVHVNKPGLKAGQLTKAGINVGKDMIGTMSNTLILVFTGASLSLMIVLYSYSVQFNQLMNMNTIAIEIIQALAGSLGVILTVPLTALITAQVYIRER